MKKIKNYFAIIFKNKRTSFAAIICAVATWLFSKGVITPDDFLSLMGFCTSLGLFLSKDGQTQTEYDKETKAGIYRRF